MIILTAGHTGPDTGAQCAATHFDEGAENIWLRNRVAEILTNRYGLVVLVDDDRASLKLLVKELNQTGRQDNLTVLKNCPPELGGRTDERSKSRNKVYFDYTLQGGRRRSQLRSPEWVCQVVPLI